MTKPLSVFIGANLVGAIALAATIVTHPAPQPLTPQAAGQVNLGTLSEPVTHTQPKPPPQPGPATTHSPQVTPAPPNPPSLPPVPQPTPPLSQPANPPAPAPAPSPPPTYPRTSVTAVMACIRQHESGGNYTIVNAYGYAGAYQLSPAYKDDWARRYGYPQWADVPVIGWPPAVQDAVALALYEDTNGHAWSDWAPYSCGW